MFKLVVLSVLLAVAVARPGVLHSTATVYSAPLVQEHSFEKVGDIVKTIPTAVSWQSSSIVHRKDHVEPIFAKVVKTYTPALHTKIIPSSDPWTIPADRTGYEIAIPVDAPSVHLGYSSGW